MAPIGVLCETIAKGAAGLRYTLSVPPQHGKTETLLMLALYCLQHKPGIRIMYVTYSDTFARAIESRTRRLLSHGLNLTEAQISEAFPKMNTDSWHCQNGSIIYWRGKGGSITGQTAELILCDDLIASSEEAASTAIKNSDWDWFYSCIESRANKNTNIIVNATRWSTDDIIGRLQGELFNYEHINIPAISLDAEGKEQALFPELHPLELLQKKRRMNESQFETMYQGHPVVKGMLLFNESPFYYTDAPNELQFSLGVDMAYSQSGSDSDFSVIAAIGRNKASGKVYLIDLYRAQVRPSDFALVLKQWQDRYQAPFYIHTGFAEKGIVELLSREHGLRFHDMQARSDKFARAQEFASCWNRGDFLISRNLKEHLSLLKETQDFTAQGRSHRRDDCIDAIASAFHAFAGPKRSFIKGMSDAFYNSLLF